MKTSTILYASLSLAMFSGVQTRAEPDPESTVKVANVMKDQYDKEQVKLKTLDTDDRKRLVDLDQLKTKVIRDSVALSQREATGSAQFSNFIHLLKIRYTERIDKKNSDFQEAAEITVDDVKDINHLFLVYLDSTPLSGRVSAGIASELLEKGRDELEKRISMHAKPNVENCSDLAIIAKNVDDTQNDLKIIAELANKLRDGVKIETIANMIPPSPARAPASVIAPAKR